MKRLIKNCIALMVILAIGFLAFKFYAPKETTIGGGTITERLEEIRGRVDKRAYISVPAATREDLSGTIVVRYQFNFNAPLKIFVQAQQGQSLGGLTSASELKKAIDAYNGGVYDLLQLTMKYVVPFDPAVRAIIIDIRLPDGSMQRAIGVVEDLRAIPNASPKVWLEKLQFVDLDLIPKTQNAAQNSSSQ